MRRTLAVLTTLVVVVGGTPAAVATQQETTTVSFEDQAIGGATVTVNSVTLPGGGFVTIHDASVTDGSIPGGVVGSSAYLNTDAHENVTIHPDEPIDESSTFAAVPHMDSNSDRVYSLVAINGEADGPYTADGDAAIDTATVNAGVTVSMPDQSAAGDSVVVDRVGLSQGGLITIHDVSAIEGAVSESIRDTSVYLPVSVHKSIRVELGAPVIENMTLVPMAHMGTDGNETHTFSESESEMDGPYTADGSPTVDTATAMPSDNTSTNYTAQATGGYSVAIGSACLPDGGFVTTHDGMVTGEQVFENIRGTSTYLESGLHRDVRITLGSPLNEATAVIPMAHIDIGGGKTCIFPRSEGRADSPYTADNSPVTDDGRATVSASIGYTTKASDGVTVVVSRVRFFEGGFVTIHDPSLSDNAVSDNVVGTPMYLPASIHKDVAVTFNKPIRPPRVLTPVVRMDTNGSEAYDFVTGEGEADGPYTADGGTVIASAHTSVNAVVIVTDQSGDGTAVTINPVTFHNGGFVTVHGTTATKGAVFENVRGISAYLDTDTHESVKINLNASLNKSGTVIPMVHMDINDNEACDFVTDEGENNGPYMTAGGVVITTANYTVKGTVSETTTGESIGSMTDEPTETMIGEPATEITNESMEMTTEPPTDAPGLDFIVVLAMLVVVTLVAARRWQPR